MSDIKHMKYWGWGDKNKFFDSEKRPYFDGFIKEIFSIDTFIFSEKPISIENIDLAPSRITDIEFSEIKKLLGTRAIISRVKKERVLHSFGKSYRDLYRARKGVIRMAPDMVVYPSKAEDISELLNYCSKHMIQVIPFGGGTNIVGGVEVFCEQKTISLDMKLMNKIVEVDSQSGLARIQAGILGPKLEMDLSVHGLTLGHFPDSFEYSTLGGWVATRSAGMQSDKYGKIEDMVLALKVVTPAGSIKTIEVPAASSGIDIKSLLIGSEGILGVIVEVLAKVHKIEPCKVFNGYFFPNFKNGIDALQECQRAGVVPMINRLNDNKKTRMSIAFKEKSKGFKEKILSDSFKKYMFSVKKFDPLEFCMCLTVFEGTQNDVKLKKNKLDRIFKKYGALSVGDSPGKTFDETKYDFPYVRDYVMDRGIIADVSETSTVWRNVLKVYSDMENKITQLERELKTKIFLSCHISHTYHSGASLYFTWASPEQKSMGALDKYDLIKDLTESVFIGNGATLSHHHATGYEHKKWMKDEVGTLGILALKSLKSTFDPNNIMNKGKVIP